MKKHYLFLLIFVSFTQLLTSQDMAERRFATQAYMRQLLQSDSTMKDRIGAIEQHTFNFRYFGVMDSVVIPVVFHVVGCTISEDDILAQLEQLNADFFTPVHPYLSDSRYQNPDAKDGNYGLTYLHEADRYENYAQKAAPPMIRFCLAAIDPEGNPTNGIISVASTVTNWGMDNAVKNSTAGGSSPWNTQRYCNIWIAPLADRMAGYTQRPGGAVETDGVVISQQYFRRAGGTVPDGGAGDFALGRTLVHLMGSYLNLHELWNETEPCGDDFVDDTPIHNAPNFGKGEYKHVSTCGDNPIEMTMNLMDSGSDSSMYMFTWGQVVRMQATLAEGGPRYSLTGTATNCETDGGGFTESEDRSKNETGSLRLKIVPNPNNGDFMIEVETENAMPSDVVVQLFNPSGVRVWEKTVSNQPSGALRIPVVGQVLPSGIYTLQVVNKSERLVKKVVVNNR